jgi:hypothetical protein
MLAMQQSIIPPEVEQAASLVAQLLPDLGELEPIDAAELHAWALWGLVGLFGQSLESRLRAAHLIKKGVHYTRSRSLEAVSDAGEVIVARLIYLYLHEPEPTPFAEALAASTKIGERRLHRASKYGLRESAIRQLRARGYEPPYLRLPENMSRVDCGSFVEFASVVLLSFGDPDDRWTERSGRSESDRPAFADWAGPNWRDVE